MRSQDLRCQRAGWSPFCQSRRCVRPWRCSSRSGWRRRRHSRCRHTESRCGRLHGRRPGHRGNSIDVTSVSRVIGRPWSFGEFCKTLFAHSSLLLKRGHFPNFDVRITASGWCGSRSTCAGRSSPGGTSFVAIFVSQLTDKLQIVSVQFLVGLDFVNTPSRTNQRLTPCSTFSYRL